MRKCLLFILAAVMSSAAFAQDMIVLRNDAADEIAAKVLEIGETQIRYRKFSHPDGPVYTIGKREVFFIRYENGEKELITAYEQPAAAAERAESRYSAGTERTPLREKRWEVGVEPRIALGAMFLKDDDDSGIGPVFGPTFGFNYYFSRYSPGFLGASLGYMYSFLSFYNTRLSMSSLDMDIYYGQTGTPGEKWGFKSGLTFSFPLAGSLSFDGGSADLKDAFNPLTVWVFTQAGGSWKHNDVGIRVALTFLNTLKSVNSSYYMIGAYYAYRF